MKYTKYSSSIDIRSDISEIKYRSSVKVNNHSMSSSYIKQGSRIPKRQGRFWYTKIVYQLVGINTRGYRINDIHRNEFKFSSNLKLSMLISP